MPNKVAEGPTTELFLGSIIEREWCEKHEAPQTRPCWYIYTSAGRKLAAVCNNRARRAGFRHEVTDAARGVRTPPNKK